MEQDTIAAISTPLGEGGLAVVRISGPDALRVADRCFRPSRRDAPPPSQAPSHTLHYGKVEKDGQAIDEVLLAVMRAPRTYTREDTVEIACHGGLLPAKLVLEAALAAGARPAEPGEFTKRAFLNGRLDLAQAEAVLDVIRSRTELALQAAQHQLAGKLSARVNAVRERLLETLAHIEAWIDFPEEDIEPDTGARLLEAIRDAEAQVARLLASAREGRLLRRGVRAVITGRVNAGKSSLLNRLLGEERAIVAPSPGTTRDTIEETADIRGLPVVCVDTAGLRDTTDAVEAEGVRRARSALDQADLALHVLDGSEPLAPEDAAALERIRARPHIVVVNKIDLPQRLRLPPLPEKSRAVRLSCLTGEGVETLKDAIRETVWAGEIRADTIEVMINARHREALRRAAEALARAAAAQEREEAPEFVALDLRLAAEALGEIVGKTFTEDLLDRVFSRFCIGK